MEGWSNLRNDPNLRKVESVEEHTATSYSLDIPIEECRFQTSKERLRVLFDQVLVAFLRDKSTSKCIRPIPALCGDGRVVDLFKLFWVVRNIGGYESVSRDKLWGFVAQECGLSFGVIPSIKLICFKYLNELDQWLRHIFKDGDMEYGKSGVLPKLDLWSRELETKLRDSLWEWPEEQEKVGDICQPEYFKYGKHINPDNSKCENCFLRLAQQSTGNVTCEMHEQSERSNNYMHEKLGINNDSGTSAKRLGENGDNELHGFSNRQISNYKGKSCVINNDSEILSRKKIVNKIHNLTDKVADDEYGSSPMVGDNRGISAKKVVEEVICKVNNVLEIFPGEERKCSAKNDCDTELTMGVGGNEIITRKRKHESQSLARMLNWLRYAAKHSDNPAIGKIPECSKWKDYDYEEFWKQALWVRETLLLRRRPNTNTDESLWQDQLKRPRIHPSVYKQNVPNHPMSEKLSCCRQLPPLTICHLCSHCNSSEATASTSISQQKANIESSPSEPAAVTTNSNDMPEKQVFVGPLFQAEIPEWIGVLSQSDTKWLGTRVWPPEDVKGKSRVELSPIGNGRQLSCNCQYPDSIECVRFHIAENRLTLKCELGSSFYHWRFNHMGEEVSLSWTKEEEKRFKDSMRSHAAFPKKFWNNAYRILPSKTRQQLISYYFNVFLIQRRSYQNRVCPFDIDSDDDEKECGSIGDSFGYKAINVSWSKTISCTQNEECTDMA